MYKGLVKKEEKKEVEYISLDRVPNSYTININEEHKKAQGKLIEHFEGENEPIKFFMDYSLEEKKELFDNDIWLTKEGVKIPLKEINYTHLKNILYMMKNHKVSLHFIMWHDKIKIESSRRGL